MDQQSQIYDGSNPVTTVVQTETLYGDFVPIDIFLCEDCFTRTLRRAKLRFWAGLILGVAGIVGVVLAPSTSPGTSDPGEVALVTASVIAIVGGLLGVGTSAFIYLSPKPKVERRLLERCVWKPMKASGRDTFWSPEDFEKLRPS